MYNERDYYVSFLHDVFFKQSLFANFIHGIKQSVTLR